MYRGPTVRPLTVAPRNMPEGALPVAVDGQLPEPSMTREYMTIHEHNPLQPTLENLEVGKNLYLTNCAPCHGNSGKGDGPVVHLLKTRPTNLVTGISKDLPDGYIYGTIRDGGVAMPSYADAMSSRERWDVLMFVRSLQQPGVANK